MTLVSRLRRSSDRGAVLVHVAIAMVVLLALSSFAIDYGVFWVARSEAQNSADTGAMAAAVAWAYDNSDDIDAAIAAARESAVVLAQRNTVWFQAPAIDPDTDVTFFVGSCPAGTDATNCVRVDVYRDAARGNALPSYFGHLLGVTSQNVRATATAGIRYGNGSDCLAPFALPDRWTEHYDKDKNKESTFDPEKSRFEKYCEHNLGCGPAETPDVYVPPGAGGTGYRYTDPPSQKLLKVDDFDLKLDKNDEVKVKDFKVRGNRYLALAIPRTDGASGTDGYAANFRSCSGQMVRVGDTLPVLDTDKDLNIVTGEEVLALFTADPFATWNNGRVVGSCAQDNPPCPGARLGFSPRVLAVPLFDPDWWTDCMLGKIACDSSAVKIVNIVGLFIGPQLDKDGAPKVKDLAKGKFRAAMLPIPGLVGGGPPVDGDYSFLRQIILVR